MTIAPGRPPRRMLLIALIIGLAVLLAGVIVARVLVLGGTPPTPMVTVPETVNPTITPTPTGVPAPPED